MESGQQLLSVAVVLAALGAALWWLRRRGFAVAGAGRGPRRLEALERLALSPQHTLHAVRAGDAVILVGCSPRGCEVLRELGPAGGGAA